MLEQVTEAASIAAWAAGLDEVHRRIAPRFARAEPRQRALAYVRGLLHPVERKNGWQLAERAGERSPDGMQRLLAAATWDADGVRDDLRTYVVEHVGARDAVLVVDETGFSRKAPSRLGCSASTAGPRGGSRTARSACSLATPARGPGAAGSRAVRAQGMAH